MSYKTVLVDDEPWALNGLVKSYEWEQNGFEIILSTINSYEAEKRIINENPSVALVDIRMRGLDGLELIRHCRQRNTQTLFIIVTAFDDFLYAKTAISLGVFEYLLKPVNKQELCSVMERVLEFIEADNEESDIDSKVQNGTINASTFDNILCYIDQHYCEDLHLSDLSKQFYFRQTYICDLFRKNMETTFTEYLNEVRLRKAYRLISKEGIRSADAATQVGYNSYSYFTRLFKLRFGINPSQLCRGFYRD